MGCTSSTHAGGVDTHTLPFQIKSSSNDIHHDDDDIICDGDELLLMQCRNGLMDAKDSSPSKSSRRANQCSRQGSQCGQSRQDNQNAHRKQQQKRQQQQQRQDQSSSSWGPMCPASCQSDARTLRILPSMLGNEDSPERPDSSTTTAANNGRRGPMPDATRHTCHTRNTTRATTTTTTTSSSSSSLGVGSRLNCHCDHTAPSPSPLPLHHHHLNSHPSTNGPTTSNRTTNNYNNINYNYNNNNYNNNNTHNLPLNNLNTNASPNGQDATASHAGHPAFAHRQWLILNPETKFDLNTLHPPLPPFLGTMYWTAASPLREGRRERKTLGTCLNSNNGSNNSNDSNNNNSNMMMMMMDNSLMDSPEKSVVSQASRMNEEEEDGCLDRVPSVPSLGIARNHGQVEEFPSLVTPSTVGSGGFSPSATTRFGLMDIHNITGSNDTNKYDSNHHHHHDIRNGSKCNKDHHHNHHHNYKMMPSLNSTCSGSSDWSESSSAEDSHWNTISSSNNNNNNNNGKRNGGVDTSREILDYSALEESYILHTSMEMHRHRSPQTPRRLFDEEEEEEEEEEDSCQHQLSLQSTSFQAEYETQPTATAINSTSPINTTIHSTARSIITPSSPSTHSSHTTPHSNHNNNSNTTHPPAPHPSPTVATFTGPFGSRRERHISTLPSQIPHQPIRLRVTETSTAACPSNNQGDFFSYDPYFSSGKYLISTMDGRTYGNGLFIKMGSQFMTLEDSTGAVLAVIKSRYTHTPSVVVYAPKRRYGGQSPSGHRLTSLGGKDGGGEICVDGNHVTNVSMGDSAELYPWALIQKEGRTMGDEVTVHLVDSNDGSGLSGNGASGNGNSGRNRSSSSSGIFNSAPAFRGRHEFDCELQTHTVVSRTASSNANNDIDDGGSRGGAGNGKEEVPCCVIVRDPSNLDAMDITIAPGIDPLLMICYLASHSKMDVEPIMGGF